MKKKVTVGTTARAMSVNMFVIGLGMMVCSCVVAVAGCVMR